MKRKIISFVICVMLCLSSLSVFAACKDENGTISKAKAKRELYAAFQTVKNSDAVFMKTENETGYVSIYASENLCFEEFESNGNQTWSEKEGDYWYDYDKYTDFVGEQPTIKFVKRLSLDIKEDPRVALSASLQQYTHNVFSKASKEKDELKVVYKKIQEGKTVNFTYVVKKGKLQSIQGGIDAEAFTVTLKYGQEAVDSVPIKPSGVEWDVYVPSIEIEGLKEQYNVGEVLNYDYLTINYFEDESTEIPQEIEVTPDMIEGFSTSEAGNFQMTIKFLNLTLEIDYEVIE